MPAKLTPQRAVDLVALHGSIAAAADSAGIIRQTFTHHFNNGRRLGLKPAVGSIPDKQEMARALKRDAQRALDVLALNDGNQTAAARELEIPRSTLQHRIDLALRFGLTTKEKPRFAGRDNTLSFRSEALPRAGEVKRYLLTCAQNNTGLNAKVWSNLLALAKHYRARIFVSRFTYDKASHGKKSVKPGTWVVEDRESLWYDPRIEPYICDERVKLAPGLAWCGEVQILPTASRPLSGFESYTGRDSGIFPHTKIAMQSIASGKGEATKFNYTTGCVTRRNYIQKKAGLKAEFHHAYGALLVEVDHEGNWWCRQINADRSADIYDLDVKVSGGRISTGHRVEAITWGDIHVGQESPIVRKLAWGKGGMLDSLKPKYQFFHDVLGFMSRGHHDIKDPHKMFLRYVRGEDSVAKELGAVRDFLNQSKRPFSESIVVASNHHHHMMLWLKEADPRKDPVNAEFYLEAQAAVLRAIRKGGHKKFKLLAWAIDHAGGAKGVRFLQQDESFIICKRAGDGIECGMHADKGPGGSKGSAVAFARMGRKSNIAHGHYSEIVDGVYRAGTSTEFDMDYNEGPSNWSHSHIVTYANGKRRIVTMWAGRWRA